MGRGNSDDGATEWALTTPRRSRGRIFVWLLVIAAALGIVGVTGYGVVVEKLDLNVAGLFGPKPTPFHRAPVGTAAPAPASPGATVNETEAPGTSDPLRLFATFLDDTQTPYHLDATARVQQDGSTMSLRMSVDQTGTDFALSMTIHAPGRNSTVRAVLKDGKAYAKDGDKPWVAGTNPSALSVPNASLAFAGISRDKLEELGREMHDGRRLYHLRVYNTTAAGLDASRLASAGCPTRDLPWDVWVTDAGDSSISATATYVFSRVGKPIVIQLPAKFR
jgi:hypothetical protein